MANRKFQLKQRVNTPMGPATVDALPYCETTDDYIVWTDKPYRDGNWIGHELVIPEKYMSPL